MASWITPSSDELKDLIESDGATLDDIIAHGKLKEDLRRQEPTLIQYLGQHVKDLTYIALGLQKSQFPMAQFTCFQIIITQLQSKNQYFTQSQEFYQCMHDALFSDEQFPEKGAAAYARIFQVMTNANPNNLLKGLEFLGELIDCTINHQPIDLQYRTYAGNETKSIVHPYHLKQFNNRWFLIGLQEGTNENYITNKALDRIVKFSRANVPFIPNNNIDFNEYFKDVLGVTIPSPEVKIENIILKFDEDRFPYVVTKPIHHSQIVLSKDDRTVQISVRPNPELEAHILFYGDQVEVIKPQWLRERIIEKIKNNLNKYASMQVDCTERL